MTADPSIVAVTTPASSNGAPRAAEPPQERPQPASLPEAPAAAESPLLSLRDRKRKLEEKLYRDIRVPRWGEVDEGPQIWIRFQPASPSEHAERLEKLQRQQRKPKDWAINANANLLVSACIGVFAVPGDEPYEQDDENRQRLSLRDGDPHGDWTRFDPDLAYSLGLDEHCGAVAVVRGLFFTEADIVGVTNELLQWSGMVLPNQQRDFSNS